MSMDWTAQQISATSGTRNALDLVVPRYNPRPTGSIHVGSASQAVLALLTAHPGQYFTHHQILTQTGRTQKSLSWALIYLRSMKLIACATDDSRNARYLRYCLTPTKKVLQK